MMQSDRKNPLSRPGPGTLRAELSVLKAPYPPKLGSRAAREMARHDPTEKLCPSCGGGMFHASQGGVVCDACGTVYFWRTEKAAPKKKAKAISSRQWEQGGRC
jgi:hypothetical protein